MLNSLKNILRSERQKLKPPLLLTLHFLVLGYFFYFSYTQKHIVNTSTSTNVSKEIISNSQNTTINYKDSNTYIFSVKDKKELQAPADVTYKLEGNSTKYLIKFELPYDLNNDRTISSTEILTIDLPRSLGYLTFRNTSPRAPQQHATFIAESFSFQKDKNVLVSTTEIKQQYYENAFKEWNGLGQHPLGIEKVRSTKYITHLSVLEDVGINERSYTPLNGYVTVEGDIPGGDYWGEHFFPICYEEKENTLYFMKSTESADTYYKSTLVTNVEAQIVKKINFNQISCLSSIVEIQDIPNLFKQ